MIRKTPFFIFISLLSIFITATLTLGLPPQCTQVLQKTVNDANPLNYTVNQDGYFHLGRSDDDWNIYLTRAERDRAEFILANCDAPCSAVCGGCANDNDAIICDRNRNRLYSVYCKDGTTINKDVDVKKGDVIRATTFGGEGNGALEITLYKCQYDRDNDGFYDATQGGNDCNDNDSTTYPGAQEICNDRKDNNCDGIVDNIEGDIIQYCTNTCTNTSVVWDTIVSRCCGDDPVGNNLNGTSTTIDDPDWSQTSCTQCHGEIGLSLQNRYWDETVARCCGDDADDDPDMGAGACTNCKLGQNVNDTSKRIWDIAAGKCCGDDSNDDPDMGQSACTRCPIGRNANTPSTRVWDSSSNSCCGDDDSDDPDRGQLACSSCPIGLNQGALRDFSSAGCCGDDAADCGLTSGNYLCRMEQNNLNPNWHYTDSQQFGDIVDAPCNGFQYLGTENSWKICDSKWIQNVQGHDYLCVV